MASRLHWVISRGDEKWDRHFSKNTDRKEKKLWTEANTGEKIKCVSAEDEEKEAEYIECWRDRLAATVMQLFVKYPIRGGNVLDCEQIAVASYELADAMIKERSKTTED